MQKIVLSNRSQSYLKLKKHHEAESDADAALGFDSDHLKSLQRRGTARYYLGKLRLSTKDFNLAQSIQFTPLIAEYQKKVQEKLEKLRVEMVEKMKRKGKALTSDEDQQSLALIKVTVQEINAPVSTYHPVSETAAKQPRKEDQQHKSALKHSHDTIPTSEDNKDKKKKKKKKAKGIDAFLENDDEAQAFATQEVPEEEEAKQEGKKKKSVIFNLDKNTTKEFDKTKKIVEVEE